MVSLSPGFKLSQEGSFTPRPPKLSLRACTSKVSRCKSTRVFFRHRSSRHSTAWAITQPRHSSDAAAGENKPRAHRQGRGSTSPSNAAALWGFTEKGHRNFLEAATCRFPGLEGIFHQLPPPPRADPLPKRSGQTPAVKDSSLLQAGMSRRSSSMDITRERALPGMS